MKLLPVQDLLLQMLADLEGQRQAVVEAAEGAKAVGLETEVAPGVLHWQ